jgi:hypothetical protein
MPELIAALDAFRQEHRRCGELDGGVEDERVWMACDCGADIVHPIEEARERAKLEEAARQNDRRR